MGIPLKRHEAIRGWLQGVADVKPMGCNRRPQRRRLTCFPRLRRVRIYCWTYVGDDYSIISWCGRGWFSDSNIIHGGVLLPSPGKCVTKGVGDWLMRLWIECVGIFNKSSRELKNWTSVVNRNFIMGNWRLFHPPYLYINLQGSIVRYKKINVLILKPLRASYSMTPFPL